MFLKKLAAARLRLQHRVALWLPSHPVSVWLTFGLGVFILTALIAGVGPSLQQHALHIPVTSAPTIYESVYPDTVARFPALNEWIILSISWTSLAIAAAVTLISMRARTVHGFALGAGFTLAAIYTISDIILKLNDTEVSLSAGITANFIGGILFSALIYIFSSVIVFTADMIPNIIARRSALLIIAALFGVSISSLVYFSVIFFYKPLSANIEITAQLPLSGSVGPFERHQADSGENNKNVSAADVRVMPLSAKAEKIHIFSVNQVGVMEWKAPTNGHVYSLDAYVSTGCVASEELVGKGRPFLSVRDVRSFELMNGASDATVIGLEPFTIEPSFPNITQFRLRAPVDEKVQEIEYFVSEGDTFRLGSGDGFSVGAAWMLFEYQAERFRARRKTAEFTVDGKRYKIEMIPPSTIRDVPLVCRSAQMRLMKDQTDQNISIGQLTTESLVTGLAFRIRQSDQRLGEFSTADSSLSLRSMSGWIESTSTLVGSGSYIGNTGFMILDNGSGSIALAGVEVAKNWDRLFSFGRFEIFKTRDGDIRISGVADAIWRNGVKLNKTRWESIGEGFRIFLLTVIVSIIGTMIAWTIKNLKLHYKSDPKNWF